MSKVMYEKEQIDKVLVLLDQVRVEGLQSFRNMTLAEMTLRDFKLVQEQEGDGRSRKKPEGTGKEADDGSNKHS